MFNKCKLLIPLPDKSKWNTSDAPNMKHMFQIIIH